MGIGLVDSNELDEFVAECDRRGGIADPDVIDLVGDFSLAYSTPVDEDLDGFSEDYVAMQLRLYREISGRVIDQESNEMQEVDLPRQIDTANPYGSAHPDIIADHARTVLNAVIVSDLPPRAEVLDMGCGWGLSSEMFGFCGCRVTGVDINPRFVELVSRRARARGYDITVRQGSFDSFATDEEYDLVFFYESLHHAIRPWELINRLGRNVKRGGKITIAGEPIQSRWWRTWGLRLDGQSVYSIRKFGWFESGWSDEFISACFDRAGFELTLLPGIGIQHSAIGVAVRRADDVATPTAHWVVPPSPPAPVRPGPHHWPSELARRVASKAAGFARRPGVSE